MFEEIMYKIGEIVRVSGLYVCVPCGYKKRLNAGDTFPSCVNCMQKQKEEQDEFSPDAFAVNLETWELLEQADK
jgi:hypothetical protein